MLSPERKLLSGLVRNWVNLGQAECEMPGKHGGGAVWPTVRNEGLQPLWVKLVSSPKPQCSNS